MYNKREQILFIQIAKLKKFSTLKNSPCPLTQSIKVHRRALVLLPCLISLPSLWKLATLTIFDHATWQHTRESPRHVRGLARIYDVRMAQFVLKIEKLSHIMGPRGSQDLRSPSPIMVPNTTWVWLHLVLCVNFRIIFPQMVKCVKSTEQSKC